MEGLLHRRKAFKRAKGSSYGGRRREFQRENHPGSRDFRAWLLLHGGVRGSATNPGRKRRGWWFERDRHGGLGWPDSGERATEVFGRRELGERESGGRRERREGEENWAWPNLV